LVGQFFQPGDKLFQIQNASRVGAVWVKSHAAHQLRSLKAGFFIRYPHGQIRLRRQTAVKGIHQRH
jgi:hypothetical protein